MHTDRLRTWTAVAATIVLAASAATAMAGTPSAPSVSSDDVVAAAAGQVIPIVDDEPSDLVTASETPSDPAASPTPLDDPTAADESADPTTCVERSTTHPVLRIAGDDRAATAACASGFGFPDGAEVAVLARGDAEGGLADALAGTVLAHDRTAPVLLTTPTDLPDATAAELRRLGVADVIVLGGPAAVSTGVVREVEELGIDVRRISGSSREATAAAIAGELDTTTAFVVNGRKPADALVAGAAAAREGAALLLVDTDRIPDATVTALGGITDVTIVGGFGVVGDAVDRQLRRTVTNVTRLGGASRYETAATVARVHPGAGTIHLVAGATNNLVDAIAAGWLGAREDGGAVGYLAKDEVPQGTDRWLRLGPLAATSEVRLFGGTGALSPTVVTAIEERLDEADAGGTEDELRGIWVHLFDESIKTREGIERTLDAATTANLNTVVVQVARRSDAYYDSAVIPRTVDPTFARDLDLLGELIPAAHARGLQVHAWFSVTPSDHSVFATEAGQGIPLPADHINVQHGPESGDSWMATLNLPNYDYLDPAIPGVQDHIATMVTEVAANYDVDGIHLDYLRYGGQARTDLTPPQLEHPITEQRYRDHGLDGEGMREFMGAQTQDLARRIHLEVAAVAPDVVISAAVLALGQGPTASGGFEGTRTWAQKAQGWPTWIEEGLIDHAFPMMYFDQDKYADWFEDWRQFAIGLNTLDTVVAPGLGTYLNDDADKQFQTDAVTSSLDGVVIFSHQAEALGEGTPYFRGLATGTFTTPAAVPAVPERVAPTRGHLLLQASDGDIVVARGPDGTTISRRADATGHAGFVRLLPGTWTVSHDGATTELVVEPGVVTRATL